MASTIYSKAGADTAIAAAVDALVIPDSPDDIGAAAVAHTHTLAAITDAGDAAGLNVGTTAGTVAAGDHTHAELHTHANTVALAAVSGTNTGDEPAASTTVAGIVELATTTEATAGTDTTRAVTPAGVAAAIAGVGGGVTDHGALTGLADDDHALYALTDGTRGAFAPPLGADDNYVTDAEKAKLANLSGTNTGDQTLPTWSTIAGKPAVVAAGATAADARAAIGAGTSNLAIGTTATDAAPGNHDHDSRYVRTVNGVGPDGSGDVAVAGGGGSVSSVAGRTGDVVLSSADLTDHTEATQDVVGAMVVGAGGTYDDGAGTITLPSGGGSSAPVGAAFSLPSLGAWRHAGYVVGGIGDLALTLTRHLLVPIDVDAAGKVSGLAIRVTTAAAGALVRLGLWAPNTEGGPGTLLTEQVADASTAGVIEVTFPGIAVQPGRHWVSVIGQIAACTIRSYSQGLTAPNKISSYLLPSGALAAVGFRGTPNASGPLPASISIIWEVDGSAPLVAVRIEA